MLKQQWFKYQQQPKRQLRLLLPLLVIPLLGFWLIQESTDSTRSVIKQPQLVLWAWERPEDLSYIDPQKVGVAYLAKTVEVRKQGMHVIPRKQPLSLAKGTFIIPVVRIETEDADLNDPAIKQRLLSELISLATKQVRVIQIDYDAKASERSFYSSLLNELRNTLPKEVSISITALGSWCKEGAWLDSLPVEEAVPMLFRMGPDGKEIKQFVERNNTFRSVKASASYGISLDEPIALPSTEKRIYLFNPKCWTRTTVNEAVRRLSNE